MPITITLTGTNPPDVVEVGLTEERTQVLLDVILDPGELTGTRGLEVKPPPERADVALPAYPEDGNAGDTAAIEVIRLGRRVEDLELERDHYGDEAERLAKLLATIRDERAVTRWLDADEARELAAVLWHYAGETERR